MVRRSQIFIRAKQIVEGHAPYGDRALSGVLYKRGIWCIVSGLQNIIESKI